jgi:hypothetical protein
MPISWELSLLIFFLAFQIPCTDDLLTTSGMQLALMVQPLAIPHPSDETVQVMHDSLYVFLYFILISLFKFLSNKILFKRKRVYP